MYGVLSGYPGSLGLRAVFEDRQKIASADATGLLRGSETRREEMPAWDPCDECKNRIREAVCVENLAPPPSICQW